jgi:Asp-tRNA(Asn)/Glu-tRNA(Gln) amidotransferase A subunit family amidase
VYLKCNIVIYEITLRQVSSIKNFMIASIGTMGNGTDIMPFGVTLFADTLNDCELLDLAERYEAELAGT